MAETLPNEREAIMTLGEQLEQRGQQKSEHQKALTIAKDVELDFIEEVTELSAEEIATLMQKH